jgi:hypothetical protein
MNYIPGLEEKKQKQSVILDCFYEIVNLFKEYPSTKARLFTIIDSDPKYKDSPLSLPVFRQLDKYSIKWIYDFGVRHHINYNSNQNAIVFNKDGLNVGNIIPADEIRQLNTIMENICDIRNTIHTILNIKNMNNISQQLGAIKIGENVYEAKTGMKFVKMKKEDIERMKQSGPPGPLAQQPPEPQQYYYPHMHMHMPRQPMQYYYQQQQPQQQYYYQQQQPQQQYYYPQTQQKKQPLLQYQYGYQQQVPQYQQYYYGAGKGAGAGKANAKANTKVNHTRKKLHANRLQQE